MDGDAVARHAIPARQAFTDAPRKCGRRFHSAANAFSTPLKTSSPQHAGRVVAFEPDPETFTQYFFIGVPEFESAGLMPEVGQAIEQRLAQKGRACADCERPATWLWLSREEVATLDAVERIREAPGEALCAKHGSQKLCSAFEEIAEANVFYMNLPYGEAGAYVWI